MHYFFQSESVEFFFKNARGLETAERHEISVNDTECEGDTPNDVTDLREIKYKGVNLRELSIPYEPSKHGRKIAKIFGKNLENELIHSMIEPEGNNASRPLTDLQKQADFKEFVLWAYSKRGPVKALYAYQMGRNSANQHGRELKTTMRSPGSEEILASQDRTCSD